MVCSRALTDMLFLAENFWTLQSSRSYKIPKFCHLPGPCLGGSWDSFEFATRFPGEGIDYPLQYSWAFLWLTGKECLQRRRPRFDPWVGKIPWRREQLFTPVFWPGEFLGLYIHGVTKSQTRLSHFPFHSAQEKTYVTPSLQLSNNFPSKNTSHHLFMPYRA